LKRHLLGLHEVLPNGGEGWGELPEEARICGFIHEEKKRGEIG